MTTVKKSEIGSTLYMSFLPMLVVLGIIAGAGYFLLKGEIEFPSFIKSKTEIRRLDGFPTVAFTNDKVDKQRLVIKSEEELNEFLNTIDSTGQLVLLEDINFEEEYVIAAATETLDTTGYEMRIKKVYEDKEKNTLLVSLIESRPSENCEIDTQTNVAVDLVAITKTDWNFDFERVTKMDECE